MQQESTIHTACLISFTRLNQLFDEQGEIETPGGITITKIALRGDENLLYADAEVQGLYSGKATLQLKPAYDPVSKNFTVSDVDIRLDEDNMFAKFAGKMLNNLLGEKMDAKISELINSRFRHILEEILSQLTAVTLPKGGTLHFNTSSWQLSDLTTGTDGVSIMAALTGIARLEY